MMDFWKTNYSRPLLAVCVAVGAPMVAVAQISVSASVQPASTTVGEPVQLSVTINGSQRVAEVPSVNVEGAQCQHIGASTQMRLINTNLSVSLTHRYLISPTRRGELLIPAVDVTVEGNHYQTEPIKVQVLDPGQDAAGNAQLGPLAELEIPKRPVYVGESFPAEVRLLVPSDQRWRIERMPDFDTDAFTKTAFQQPQQRQQVRDGHEYDFCTFRTVMNAIKSGKVPIGPLTFNIQIAAPKKRNNNAATPFGGLFDGFPFDAQPTALIERKVILPEQTVEVRELPDAGKPASFRGAIGKFRFSTSAAQTRVKAGEPLVITLQVEGEGNFDRIEAPVLINPDGWRSYPAEASFAKTDDSGLRGVKTFRIAVVPEKTQTHTPTFEFASFDPETGVYQTVKGSTSELQVEGLKAPEPAPPVVQLKPPAPAPPPPPPEPVLMERQVALATEPALWNSRSFFWGLQAAAAAALLGLATVVGLRRRRAAQGPGRALLRRASALQASLAEVTRRTEFLRQAVQVVQLRTAARNGQPDAAVDAADAARVFSTQDTVAQELHWLFEADSETRFAGVQGAGLVDAKERSRVLALLDKLV